jgi:hypothetical protein
MIRQEHFTGIFLVLDFYDVSKRLQERVRSLHHPIIVLTHLLLALRGDFLGDGINHGAVATDATAAFERVEEKRVFFRRPLFIIPCFFLFFSPSCFVLLLAIFSLICPLGRFPFFFPLFCRAIVACLTGIY